MRAAALLLLWIAAAGFVPPPPPVPLDRLLADMPPQTLAETGLFYDVAQRRPSPGVIPYALNTQLFSDYAHKDRFIYVPEGERLHFEGDGLLAFPVGTTLIKTFSDGRTGARIETRLLVKKASGWAALPYVWQADGTAVLKRAGARMPVSVEGRAVDWQVPNVNQCKGCHAVGDTLMPIGPKARNLTPESLAALRAAGLLDGPAPGTPLPRFDDAGSAGVEARARAYLDVNCGHCHAQRGPASNSGLFLTWETTDPTARGIGKRPVAAGRGTGGHDLDIDPGHPERSILVYRMQSTETGIAMPEIGRTLVHAEAVALVRDYISGLKQ